jgi:hypothetical protein
MPPAGPVSLFDRRIRLEFVFGFQFCQELEQSSPVEVSLKRARLSIAQLFVQSQSLLNLLNISIPCGSTATPVHGRQQKMGTMLDPGEATISLKR